jgi:hypothetical protein
MKTLLTIAISLAFATVAVRADMANYQSTVTGQSPTYDFHFDNSLVDSVGGTATFTASGAGFGTDYSGNPNDAVSFSALADNLTLASPLIISGAGTTTAIGSMSMLFYMPSTVPSTAYLFSDHDTSPYFALAMSGGVFGLKIVNLTVTLPTPTANTWYYFGLTYNLNGTATGVNGANWYLGAVGGTLSSGFIQKGGSGNINTTTTMGDGGTFDLGNRRAFNNSLVGGEIDELATWNSQLSSGQITSQFNALTVSVPEPSACILFGAGGLLVLWKRRAFRRD